MPRIYNLRRDEPDHRDYRFTLPSPVEVPDNFSTRATQPPIWDQSTVGACSAFDSLRCFVFDQMKQGLPYKIPSWLFQYYGERALANNTSWDSGSTIRTAFKTMATLGVTSDELWPYDVTKFADRPTTAAYLDAAKHKSIQYHSITQDLLSLQQTLVSGFPIAFGIDVYPGLESDDATNTGIVPMPQAGQASLGGHAITTTGYYKTKVLNGRTINEVFECANSWGIKWGDAGYFYLPYEYVLSNLSSDFWVVTSVQP